jgi:carotenoid cleavage dioxygenase-like enzyme
MTYGSWILSCVLLFHFCNADYKSTVHNLFTSLKRDILTEPARVNGTIPSWLEVDRFGNGFGQFEGGAAKGGEKWTWNFLFDVTAYVLKWSVKNGEATITARMTNSTYRTEGSHHMPYTRTFAGTTPGMNMFQRMKTLMNFTDSDNFNVNIVHIGGKTLAISDMNGFMEIDATNLDTKGLFHFTDSIAKEKIDKITCAHPSQLPFDPYVYNYAVNMQPGNLTHDGLYTTQFYRIDTRKTPLAREIVWRQASNKPPPYMHQFAHTQNFLVLFEYPLWWHEMGIAMSLNVLPNMVWKPKLSNGTRVQVLDKRSWKVVHTYQTDPFFAYHHLNAFEEDGHVIVDIMTVPCEGTPKGMRASCLHMNAFNLETLRTAGWEIPRGSLRRFRVPVDSASAWGEYLPFEDLNHFGMDLYAIHPALKGKKYRYVWSMGNHGDASHHGVWWNSILKIDTKTNETRHWYKEDHYASEVSFIPRPGATEEDDGVLISTVLGVPQGRSYLLILDGKTLEQIATADAPEFLPFPSHGHSCAPINGQSLCFWG